jgi:hypothetical protein
VCSSDLTAAIVAIDQADGMVSRKLGVDGPKRRALDSAVDAVIIGAGLGWALDLAISKQVKQGDISYKLPHLTKAAYALAAHQGSNRAMKVTGALALAVNAQIAWDYYKGWTSPERQTMLDTGVVQVPGFYDERRAARKFVAKVRPQLNAGAPRELTAGNNDTDTMVIDSTAVELPNLPDQT